MSSNEIAGLQALAKSAGGSLTINPETGLAEAGFLDNLLPTIIGAGLMYATGGAAGAAAPGLFGMSMPATIGMGVGALQTARTGDLGKGLMAGLGAAGGAGMLGSALAGGATNIGAGVVDQATQDATYSGLTGDAYNEAVQKSVADKMAGATNAEMLSAYTPATQGYGSLKNIGMAAAPAIMGAMQPEAPSAAVQDRGMVRPYQFSYNAQTPENPEPLGASYTPGQDTSERTWFKPSYSAMTPYRAAQGGLTDLARIATGEDVMPMGQEEKMAAGGEVFPYGESVMRMAAGGISTLGGYAAGGNPRLLKGPGDGMSDNIPAVIGAKQPARLADGEFVVPADVVSHLGNGSTDAGAKQLYKMMDRIRQKRTGKKKQAPQVNASRALPA
jgi:hypothetical protein